MAVVGSVISTLTSAGSTEFTHPIILLLLDIVGPIGVPVESESLIFTKTTTSSFCAGFNRCK